MAYKIEDDALKKLLSGYRRSKRNSVLTQKAQQLKVKKIQKV